jgi:hypothetical protein
MGADRLFLGYASTLAQAANTSTSARTTSGQGDYTAQKQVDKKVASALPAISKRKRIKTSQDSQSGHSAENA